MKVLGFQVRSEACCTGNTFGPKSGDLGLIQIAANCVSDSNKYTVVLFGPFLTGWTGGIYLILHFIIRLYFYKHSHSKFYI